MPDYKKMYYLLFNETSKAIEQLQTAQQQTEELYMESDDTLIDIVNEEEKTTRPFE